MSGLDLGAVAPGFVDPALDAQAAFRAALQALSRPGRIVRCERAAYALGLALLDQDTCAWLSPAAAAMAPSLRFHTGCRFGSPADCDFLFVGSVTELPLLESLKVGSDEAPQRSATVVLEVDGLSDERGWAISGPGIRGGARLFAAGLGASFAAQWAQNARRFPRGVDFFLCCGERLCGLPRTTRLED